MALKLSKRAERISQAEIRVMSIECEKVGGINLAQGVCDTEVPLPVRRAAQAAIDSGVNSYTRCDGLADLRQAIAKKLKTFNGLTYDAETEITVSAGSTGSFYAACLALLDPGDEVVIFEPYYGYHVNTVLAVEAAPKYVTMKPPEWTFTRAELERAITKKTKAIVVNTPANPSGKVFTAEELGWIADAAKQHDLFVFTDEIYEYFLYDGRKHISPATLPGMRERTITISGFSKTFSITGWRIGYSAADAKWNGMIACLNDLVYVCAPSPLQRGVAKGLEELGPEFYAQMSKEYRVKRDMVCDALTEVGLEPFVPQGSYYILADADHLPGKDSKAKAMYLLKETRVASVPGDAFFSGDAGRHLLRFCFAKDDADLTEACKRIKQLAAKPARATVSR
jgi:aminotransferase